MMYASLSLGKCEEEWNKKKKKNFEKGKEKAKKKKGVMTMLTCKGLNGIRKYLLGKKIIKRTKFSVYTIYYSC